MEKQGIRETIARAVYPEVFKMVDALNRELDYCGQKWNSADSKNFQLLEALRKTEGKLEIAEIDKTNLNNSINALKTELIIEKAKQTTTGIPAALKNYQACKVFYNAWQVKANGMDRLIQTDVKSFIEPNNDWIAFEIRAKVRQDSSMTATEKAWWVAKYVFEKFVYVYDKDQFGYTEFWQYPEETMQLGRGDCEDTAILCTTLLRMFGVDAWTMVGTWGGIGHAWTEFIDENSELKLIETTMHGADYASTNPNHKFHARNSNYKPSVCFNEKWVLNIDQSVWQLAQANADAITDGVLVIE